MVKFMVDLRTSADAAAVAGIEELREAVLALRADLDALTGSVSSDVAEDAAPKSETTRRGRAKVSK